MVRRFCTGKKLWIRPELVVLVKSNSDEMVLAACKLNSQPGLSGPEPWFATCAGTVSCTNCSAQAAS
jgi:hypothetical protein